MSELIQLEQKDLKPLRKKQWKKQKGKCPILNQKIPFEKSVLDHLHITKKEIKEGKVGEDGKGLLRGVLDPFVNAWEGKVSKSFIRVGLHKRGIDISDALERLAEYLRKPLIKQIYIHPTEKPKPKKLGIRDYNRIKKYYLKLYPNRRKIPKYPKAGIKKDKKGCIIYKARMTKKWEILLEQVNQYHNEYHLKGKKK